MCTGNSARSIMAEALATTLSKGQFIGYSAGSTPKGQVNPLAEELCVEMGYPREKLRSKSWDEFAKPDAPQMDFIITVCDNAAGEACPVWIGHPVTGHWGFPDPAAVEGIEQQKKNAFKEVMLGLKEKIESLLGPLSKQEIENKLREID